MNTNYYELGPVEDVIKLANSGDWKNEASSFIEKTINAYKGICEGMTILSYIKKFAKDTPLTSMGESIINDVLRVVVDSNKVDFGHYVGVLEPGNSKNSKIRKFAINDMNKEALSTTEEFISLLELLGVEQLTYMLILLDKIKYEQ